jgi:ATP-binding cassette subfamily A (ABC1) protein 3
MDSDVRAEKDRIKSLSLHEIRNSNLILKDLTKFYKNYLAVNQLCVGIDENECFGLLGVNGAGKTSTFKMLTGDEIISSGEAWVNGISVKTGMIKVHRKIGYCPQFDALLDDLTGRETLKIFCLLRGVPRNQIHNVTMQLATDLNFVQHLDKKIKAFSGGNKRKLSTSLALIGNPSVIYLDEPTTGMDPGARRQLWNSIMKIRATGKSVILTSHSMEECEALCTRLAVMVNGEFKCLGSTQHLKNKFSNGFVLTIKAGKKSVEERIVYINQIKSMVEQRFPGAVLEEAYMDILKYYVPSSDMKWSTMFGIMEEAKNNLNIDDYSLGQTSLEQIFLLFTKSQRSETSKKN